MYANRRNFRAIKEIGVEEHDGDVRTQILDRKWKYSRFVDAQCIRP